jgi:hypothetical protein
MSPPRVVIAGGGMGGSADADTARYASTWHVAGGRPQWS